MNANSPAAIQLNPLDSTRQFNLWDYNVSHSQLLLRSRPTRDHAENLDIIFVAVFYLSIPPLFRGLTIEPASPERAEKIFETIGWPPECNHRKVGAKCVFQLTTEAREYFIGAAGWRLDRNFLGPRETSLEQFIP